MELTMAFKKVKRNGRKPAVQNLVYVCNISFMFMLCLCLVYEATSCVKKQKSFCACVYDVRIVQYDWSSNRSQALFKTMDHRSRLPNKYSVCLATSRLSVRVPAEDFHFFLIILPMSRAIEMKIGAILCAIGRGQGL